MDWKTVKHERLKDPAVKRDWKASEPGYQLARTLIERRLAKGFS